MLLSSTGTQSDQWFYPEKKDTTMFNVMKVYKYVLSVTFSTYLYFEKWSP
jgi:hypothetical protein